MALRLRRRSAAAAAAQQQLRVNLRPSSLPLPPRPPPQVVVEMVQNKLAEPPVKEHGWLLDGYPRRRVNCRRMPPPPAPAAAAAGAGCCRWLLRMLLLLCRVAAAPAAAPAAARHAPGRVAPRLPHPATRCACPPAGCSGEQAEAIEKEGIRPDVFLLINVRLLAWQRPSAPAAAAFVRRTRLPSGRLPGPCQPCEADHLPPPTCRHPPALPPCRCPMSCSSSAWSAAAATRVRLTGPPACCRLLPWVCVAAAGSCCPTPR